MNASRPGTKDWWTVVRTMPWQEAMIHLNDYRAELLTETAGKPHQNATAATITRINAEITRINRLINESDYLKAMKLVLTPEQVELVRQTKIELELKANRN